jgi:hypothetical protein
MRACPNDRARRLSRQAGAALLLLAITGTGAAAQVGAPVRLSPGAESAPAPATPAASPAAAAEPSATPDATADDGIKATPLAPVDAGWIGTLPDTARPLPQSMWQGTPRAFVVAALPLLAPSSSPTLQDLARRLLLSNAIAPAGGETPDSANLAATRVAQLAALGDIDDAVGLIDALPPSAHGDELDRRRVELAFARNESVGACRIVQEDVARYQGPWWEQALIACQALTGNQAEAALGLSLMHEQKAPVDPVFETLIDALGGRPARLEKLPQPSPLLVTLVAAAKLPLPADAVAAADLPTLRTWAANDGVPPLQRLAAAERAAALGALSPEALAALYGAVEFKPDELGTAIKKGKAPTTPRERALLYSVARSDPAVAARTAALQAFLADARKRGEFLLGARVVAPILDELSPSQELAEFAPDAVMAAIANGDKDRATAWLAVAPPGAVAMLAPLLRLVPIDVPAAPSDLQVPPPSPQQATLMLALRSSVDPTVSPAAWAPLLAGSQPGTLPNAALWLDQQQASADKRVGETVLTTAIIARDGDHLSKDPIVLNRAILGLKAIGLDPEARALAVEAALAGGT